MEEVVTIHEDCDNATGINKYLVAKAAEHGEIIKKNINKDPDGVPIMRFEKYIPKNPKRYWIIIIDHISLLKEERGFTLKQNIDKMSSYLVGIRNNFGATPVVIQQLAFDSENDERHKSGRLTPTVRDFGDSKYTTRDANVIMTLFNPAQYQLDKFQGYNVNNLGNSYRNLEILLNRDGEPNINLGLNFIGPCGTFRELPRASEMNLGIEDACINMSNGRAKFIKNSEDEWIPNPNAT